MRRYAGAIVSVAATFAAFVAYSGCSSDTPAAAGRLQGCLLNSDCNNPLSCTFGRCHVACNATNDCERGERCVKLPTGNVCQAADETECLFTSNCPSPLKCAVDSKCRVACEGDPDCLSSQKCVSHVCADNADIDTQTGDLPRVNPNGGWDGVRDDGGIQRPDASDDGSTTSDGAAADMSVNPPDGTSPVEAAADAKDAGLDVARPPPCSDSGPALLGFHPSNLPATFTIPDGIQDFTYTRPNCSFDTDMPGWQAASCSTGFGPETRFQVVTLSDGREAAVLFAQSLTVNASAVLQIIGQRPLIIAVNGKAEINGSIVAKESPTNGWYGGGAPGTNTPTRVGICPLDTGMGGGQPGGAQANLGVGAGGGGFCGLGGDGSSPADGGTPPPGGSTYGMPSLVPLVGGSSGGSTVAFTRTNHGGGAVQIVSGTNILIGDSGVINMGGGAFQGVNGPGGGSGGGILLEAPSITIRGVLAANGGGGSAAYADAQDGLASDQPALGARQDSAGTHRAGNGSAGMVAKGGNGDPVANTNLVSAGGGGGAGRIRINTGCGGTLTLAGAAIVSPAEATGCFTKGALQ